MQTIVFYRKENALIVKEKYNHKKEDKSASTLWAQHTNKL